MSRCVRLVSGFRFRVSGASRRWNPWPPADVDWLPMRVNLLYFASFRDAAGCTEQVRELPDGTRVRQLWETVTREVPRLAAFPAMPPAAVNREYVSAET